MPRAVGINHVALEVLDLEDAIAFWQRVFGPLALRGRVRGMAFLDLGDQFVALEEGRSQAPDSGRHFGVVVDDKEAVRERVRSEGIDAGRTGGHLRFRDPWGNNIEVVQYRDVQFTKAPHVAQAMGVDEQKSERALGELREKGILPPAD